MTAAERGGGGEGAATRLFEATDELVAGFDAGLELDAAAQLPADDAAATAGCFGLALCFGCCADGGVVALSGLPAAAAIEVIDGAAVNIVPAAVVCGMISAAAACSADACIGGSIGGRMGASLLMEAVSGTLCLLPATNALEAPADEIERVEASEGKKRRAAAA